MAAQSMLRWLAVPGIVRKEEGIVVELMMWEITRVVDGE